MFLACGMTLVIMLGGIDLSVGSVIAMVGCFAAGFISYLGLPSVQYFTGNSAGACLGLFMGAVAAFTYDSAVHITLER